MAIETATAQDKQFRLISLYPDVCITPSKKGYPVPYPITHAMDQSKQCSPNVFFAGKAAYLHNESYVDNVQGDEAGTGKGVVSQTHMKISHNIGKSPSVYVNGKPIVRTGDSMWMNFRDVGGVGSPAPKGESGKSAPKDSEKGGDSAKESPADKGVKTGLGDDVDKLAAESPSLQKDLDQLKKDGWEVEYGKEGGGSYADRGGDPKKIVIDGAKKGNPKEAVQSLSHEVGHARNPYTPDYSSKEAYLKGAMADEGAATMNNIQVQREIKASGGPDIGISGNSANHSTYNAAYDQYLKDGNAAAARDTIGSKFGAEKTSNTGQTYNDYYGGWYDKTFPPKK
jgi:type VI secretion system secreted protein VgrG